MMHRGLDGGRWCCDVGRGIVRVVAVGTARPLTWSVDGEPNPRRDGWGEDGIDLSDVR